MTVSGSWILAQIYSGEIVLPSKTVSLLFSLCLLLASSLLSLRGVNCAVTSFFWLKPGTQAVYSFLDTMLGFDDCGWAHPVRGNYSWLCQEVNYTHAVLDVEVNIEVFQRSEWEHPGYITYTGIEFLERATSGDLSFIKRVPMDQVIGRVELTNRTTPGDEYYAVTIPSPININQKFTVVVDLDNRDMINENGERWGKWTLWIDPLVYPLEGSTEELFVMNWLNTTICLNVTYKAPPSSIPKDTIFGEVKRYFVANVRWPIENEFLLELGIEGDIDILPSYSYESRTGIFLQIGTFDYLDDVLTQKFGIIKTMGFALPLFYLSSICFYCDLDSDGAVDMFDIAVVAKLFTSKLGDERWNPLADINKDGRVDMKDIGMVARAFGTQYVTTD